MGMDLNPSAILTDKTGNFVGVTNDGTNYRLCVDVRPGAGVTPDQPAAGAAVFAKQVNQPLLNGTTADMTVNGATSNKVYTAAIAANTTILKVVIQVTSTGTLFNGNGFGGVGSGGLLGTNNPGTLANGIVLAANAGGVATQIMTFNCNEDLFALNGNGGVGSVGSGSLSTSIHFVNQAFSGMASDAITMTIRDNLTTRNIYLMRAWAVGWRTA